MAACPVANSSATDTVDRVGMQKDSDQVGAPAVAAWAAANASLCVVSAPVQEDNEVLPHKHQLSSSKI